MKLSFRPNDTAGEGYITYMSLDPYGLHATVYSVGNEIFLLIHLVGVGTFMKPELIGPRWLV